MKLSRFFSGLLALLFATALSAKTIPGPKGGRILNPTAPFAEFLVEKDHTATVTFYDANLKLIPPGDRVVKVVAEAKGGKAALDFTRSNNALVSQGALPKGDDYTIVIQIKDSAAAPPKNYRVYFEDEACKICHRAQYACICDPK